MQLTRPHPPSAGNNQDFACPQAKEEENMQVLTGALCESVTICINHQSVCQPSVGYSNTWFLRSAKNEAKGEHSGHNCRPACVQVQDFSF